MMSVPEPSARFAVYRKKRMSSSRKRLTHWSVTAMPHRSATFCEAMWVSRMMECTSPAFSAVKAYYMQPRTASVA